MIKIIKRITSGLAGLVLLYTFSGCSDSELPSIISVPDSATQSDSSENYSLDASNDALDSSLNYDSNSSGRSNLDSTINDTLAEYDNGASPLITAEQEGRSLIEQILLSHSYQLQQNDGSWKITLLNPETGEYDLVLEPDFRFNKNPDSGYSYLEFSSSTDRGRGISSNYPFYREIVPGTRAEIEQQVNTALDLDELL